MIQILLIEDSLMVQQTVSEIISTACEDIEEECHVEPAALLMEAEELLQKRQDWDMVILDLGLPDAVSNETTVIRVLQLAKEIPVVVLTGLGWVEAAPLLNLGVAAFYHKGQFRAEDLLLYATIYKKRKELRGADV